MPRQSEALSAETQVMRAIDLALQKADELTGRTRERVLRYAADQVADRLGSRTSVVTPGVGWGGSGGAGPQALIAGGGAGSFADWSGSGPGGASGFSGGVGSVTVVPHDGD